MWIVRLALRRQYTFIVMALLILILGAVTISRTPTDVFPSIDIPVVSVIWSYAGISPEDMAKRVTTISERAATTTVADIEHIESQSMPGITRYQVLLPARSGESRSRRRPVDGDHARPLLRIVSALVPRHRSDHRLQALPACPILQLGCGRQLAMSETQIYDNGTNFVRTQLATDSRARRLRSPYGGKSRQIMVDLDIPALQAKGLSPNDVNNAINSTEPRFFPLERQRSGQDGNTTSFLNGSPNVIDRPQQPAN